MVSEFPPTHLPDIGLGVCRTVSGRFCIFLKVTISHSHPFHCVSGQMCTDERGAWVWNFHSGFFFFPFFTPPFHTLAVWTTKGKTMNNFCKKLAENTSHNLCIQRILRLTPLCSQTFPLHFKSTIWYYFGLWCDWETSRTNQMFFRRNLHGVVTFSLHARKVMVDYFEMIPNDVDPHTVSPASAVPPNSLKEPLLIYWTSTQSHCITERA